MEQPRAQETPQARQRIGSAPSPIKVFYSPAPGVIVSVAVSAGDLVVTGDLVCVLEAMNARHSLRADWTGIVKKVHVGAGQHIKVGDTIVELE